MFAKHLVCRARLPKIKDIINFCDANGIIFDSDCNYYKFLEKMESELDHEHIENCMRTLREASSNMLLNAIDNVSHEEISTNETNVFPLRVITNVVLVLDIVNTA